jgi:Ran GTPase-activating protein (RanGAP) involved in mRNA processing and transport
MSSSNDLLKTLTMIINFFFNKNIAIIFIGLLFALSPVSSFSFQLENRIDYDLLFKENLKHNGRILNLSGKKIGDKGVKQLVSSNYLEKVEKIDLRYNEITSVGAELLAKITPLPQLRSLILRHNILGDAGTMALAKSGSFPSLEEMQLGWTETRDAGALAFGSSGRFKNLKKLDLRGNFLSNKTKKELKKSLVHLKTLKLF